jgi:hypothetical protein
MTWVFAGAAAVSVVGGVMGNKSAGKAAGAQKKAQAKASKEQKKMYEQSRKDMEPYMTSGIYANNDLNMRMGLAGDSGNKDYGFLMKRFNNQEFEKDPGYQFRMDEGNRGIAATQAARGGLFSGAAAKEAARYNQGFASNEYGQAYNRFTNDQEGQYNKLSGIKKDGQSAATSMMGTNERYGTNMAQGQMRIGEINADLIGARNANNQEMLGSMNKLFQQGMAERKADRQASNYGVNPSRPS